MQPNELFEQITHGFADPKQLGKWMQGAWPAMDGKSLAGPTAAWVGSLESMLKGAEALRQMQLNAIHKAQKRTAELAMTLHSAASPAETMAALQAFAKDNAEEATGYWREYREIVQNAEVQMLAAAKPPAKTRKPTGGRR